ncbi:MAG: tetratricopeptide repeat protein [Bacteroidia bacterium]|nr:tetratricopeptide repeat protein [Bacteroidia bacterium]
MSPTLLKTFLPKKALFVVVLIFINSIKLIAQVPLTDSLENLINNIYTPDTTRVFALCNLARDIKESNPNRAILKAKEATIISQHVKFLHGEALSLINTGEIYYAMEKHKEALEYWFKSIAVYKQMSQSGNTHEKALGLHGITDNLIFISRLYCEIGELKNFEKHVAEAKEIMKNNPTEYSRLGWIGIEWAGCYYGNEKYDEAEQLYNDALESFRKVNDEYGIANTMANIGMLQNQRGNTDYALISLNRSLELYKKVNSLDGQAWVNNIIGNIYNDIPKYDLAINYFQQGYENSVQGNSIDFQINSLINLGNVFKKMNKATESISYWQKAHSLASKYSKPHYLLTTTKHLSNYLEQKGDHKSALHYLKNMIALKDSLNNNESMKAIGKMESQYDFDKEQAVQASLHEQELNAQKAVAIAEKKQQNAIIIGVTVGLLILLVFSVFLYNRFRVTNKQKQLIAQQKELVMGKNKEILDSIKYAKRIQAAILPAKATFKKLLPDSFIIYKPKDIVAGDFYWLEEKNNKILVAACDCTGHGVPGAMVSVICNNGMNRSVREYSITEPDEILNKTREIVIQEFEKSEEIVNDGMDLALISFSYSGDKVTLDFAGANNCVWVARKDSIEMEEIDGDKQPIGAFDDFKPYTKHQLILSRGDMVYLFTDGYKDQFGGEELYKNKSGKKFKGNRLKKILHSIKDSSTQEQKIILEEEFDKWKGNLDQIDDVCAIGIRL